ncbi:nucleotidyltransferase domain-containing protein [Microlunatus sp. GCM10028923]|uniref:nucleotidyltransferase domain-containing protein n=1 Tax=Microlunatus sp. GCM10028923 TaxID=3273400 RepID=UPI00361C1073
MADDERVCAAWLHGSSARGGGDALSDLDLVVVVPDELIKEIAGGPRSPVDYRHVLDSPRGRWVASILEPLLLLEAPQNAPAGGAFLTTLTAGADGPQQVDWEWLPRSSARRPLESVILIDRELPPVEASATEPAGPGPAPERTVFEIACHAVPWFWMTLLWNAKSAARHAGSMPMLAATLGALHDVEHFVGRESPPTSVPDRDPFGVLAGLSDRMDELRSAGSPLFADVPDRVGSQARRFIEVARAVAEVRQSQGAGQRGCRARDLAT